MVHSAGRKMERPVSNRGQTGGGSAGADSGAALVLTTLGEMALAHRQADGRNTPLLSPGKPLALLIYLACSPRHSAARDHLVDLLWSDTEPDSARHTLRQTIWYLRQRLGHETLHVSRDDGRTMLTARVSSDRDAFAAACEADDVERAVSLYEGDFLPSFGAPGAAAFEHWADLERQRLRLLFYRAAEDVVRRRLATARFREAHVVARRVRDLDPEREQGWGLVIEARLASGDDVGAQLEVAALERLIADRNREPEPVTRALVTRVRQRWTGCKPDSAPGQLVAELVGREREFSHIVAAWEAARRGPGRHVHVSAAPGVGKTRLLADVCRRLGAMGASVIVARANRGERHVAFSFVADLARSLSELPGAAGVAPDAASTLVGLNPALSARFAAAADRSTGVEALRRRSHAVRELLAAVADEAPLALLVDDLHWADGESRQVLQAVIDHVAGDRVLVVTAARPTGDGPLASEETATLVLSPLGACDIGALVSSLAQLPDLEWAHSLPDHLREASGGVPLLVLETLQLALDRAVLVREEGKWRCPQPETLSELLREGAALKRRIASLETEPSCLLLLLAVSGARLDTAKLAAASGCPPEVVDRAVGDLERRGLAGRIGDGWEPAHDEIAECAVALASSEAWRDANAALGRVLAADASADAVLLQRAARHMAAAGGETELRSVFARWLRITRRGGDRRPNRELCRQLLGTGWSPSRAKMLLRCLPLPHRAGLYSPPRVAAATGVGLALAGGAFAALLTSARPPADVTLIAVATEETGSRTAFAVPLSRGGWAREDPIELDRSNRIAGAAVPRPVWSAAPSPDGRMWAYDSVTADSGEIDLFVRSPDGSVRRLTATPGDDANPRWSPDGRLIAFNTTRWNRNRWNDLAILDIETRSVSRFATGDECYGEQSWSPDGTRIAYIESDCRLPPAMRLCTAGVDGSGRRCGAISPNQRLSVIGWYDARRLLILRDTAGATHLARFDVDGGTMQPIATLLEIGASASADGRWIACRCRWPGDAEPEWYVFPSDQPELARRVIARGSGPRDFEFHWVNSSVPSRYLERLSIVSPSDGVMLGVPQRLRLAALDRHSEPIPTRRVTWHSLDTTIARVGESTGSVLAHRLGTVVIRVSAGGWRTAQRQLIVQPPFHRVVRSENWAHGLSAEWVPYGDPQPEVSIRPDGIAAFWNRGDGWFHSGAYGRRAFRATRGLGVEAMWSTPVIGPRQQQNILSLETVDERALSQWDHRTGDPPTGEPGPHCTIAYAPGDGVPQQPYILTDGGPIPIDRHANSGTWYAVRVQILPDGRCALAVSGRPLWISDEPLRLDRPWRLFLHGNSVGTRMLVGPVEVWEGVRTDIDWGEVTGSR